MKHHKLAKVGWVTAAFVVLVSVITSFTSGAQAVDGGITVTSPDMVGGTKINSIFACDTMGVPGGFTSPELVWTPYAGAASYVVLMHDEFGADAAYDGADWSHWAVYNIGAATNILARNASAADALGGGVEAHNTWAMFTNGGEDRYRGPCPPPGAAHNYIFTVYALDVPTISPANTGGGYVGTAEMLAAMTGHILDQGDITVNFSNADIGVAVDANVTVEQKTGTSDLSTGVADFTVAFDHGLEATPEFTTVATRVDPTPTTIELFDTFTITDSEGATGKINWNLYGPQATTDGTCPGAGDEEWVTTALLGSGEVDFTGDGSYQTPNVAITSPGCYTFNGELVGSFTTVTSEPGVAAETLFVSPTPTIATAINADGYSDDVTIADTFGVVGTLTWTLYGPVPVGLSGNCSDANWVGAAVYETGTVAVTADGVVTTTPAAEPMAAGCYSYADTLSSPAYTGDAVSVVGQPSGTYLVAVPLVPPPAVTTSTDKVNSTPTTLALVETFNITDTQGVGGTINWSAYGPHASSDGTCPAPGDPAWAAAPLLGSGNVPFTGDGAYPTPNVDISAPGCYTFSGELTGAFAPVSSQPGEPTSTASIVTPTAEVVKSLDKTSVALGDTITYTIVVTNPDQSTPIWDASFSDDLAGLLDDATFNNDATATAGTATYADSKLSWQGAVPAGGAVTVTYAVTVKSTQAGDGELPNTVIMTGSNCLVAADCLTVASLTAQAPTAVPPTTEPPTAEPPTAVPPTTEPVIPAVPAVEELAFTGQGTTLLSGLALSLIMAGAGLIHLSIRRREQKFAVVNSTS